MKQLKRTLALCLALAMAFAGTGCVINADKAHVATLEDGTQVPSGVYLTYMMDEASVIIGEMDAEIKDPYKETMEDGTPVPAAIRTEAQQALREYIAINQKFDALGMELTPEEQQLLDVYVESGWGNLGALYEENNVSEASYRTVMENMLKRSALFDEVYGEGGEQEVPESELRDMFHKDYAKVMLIPLTFSTSEDAEAKAESDQRARDFIEKYYQMALGNTPFEAYVPESDELEEEPETAEGEETAPEQTPEESEPETTEPVDEPASEEAPAGEEAAEEPESGAYSLMEDIFFEAREEAMQDTELERPEPGTSYTFIPRTSASYAQNVLDAFFSAPIGTPTVVESETGIYLFVRYDTAETPSDFDSFSATLLTELKAEDYADLVKTWAENLQGVTLHQDAIDHYDPKKLKLF